MSIKQIYKELTSLYWEIGFLSNTYNDIVYGKNLNFQLVTHNYPDSWFADPFILEVTDDRIEILVEEVIKLNPKGHITKLNIDRKTLRVINKKIVFENNGHLSFPVIKRNGNRVFVYPENSETGELNMYEYDTLSESFLFFRQISDKPLTDAVITDYFGTRYMFATDTSAPNGKVLSIYRWNEVTDSYTLECNYPFSEHIARMGGDFFNVDGVVYRPAQESNSNYGHGLSIQKVERVDNQWHIKEVRRMISPFGKMQIGFHTLTSYKGCLVVDVKGYRHTFLGPFLSFIRSLMP